MTAPDPRPDVWHLTRIDPGIESETNLRDSDDGIAELAESIKAHGLLQPLGVIDRPKANLIMGFRRLKALRRAGAETCPVSVYPATITPTMIGTLQFTENDQRLDLKDFERFTGLKRLRMLNPDWSRADLATHLRKSPATITRQLSPEDLVEEAFDAFMAGEFGFSIAYSISTSKDQLAALAANRQGKGRDQLEADKRAAKEAAKAAQAAQANGTTGQAPPRVSILKLTVDGVTVTFKGEAISLDGAITAAKGAADQLRIAKQDRHDAKSFKTWAANQAKADAEAKAKQPSAG